MELDYRGERESRTRAFGALIENFGNAIAADDTVGERRQRRSVHPIPEIDAIGHGVELAPDSVARAERELRLPA
jgi:hypothetical protein